jgi:hypothetical protein
MVKEFHFAQKVEEISVLSTANLFLLLSVVLTYLFLDRYRSIRAWQIGLK